MDPAAKHFINREFLAPNVLEIDIDLELLDSLAPVCRRLQQIDLAAGPVEIGNGLVLHAKHPDWQSDIVWISQRDPAGYQYFESLFNRMGIAQAVADRIDYDRRIVMYSGFFVTRQSCVVPNFHFDWVDANNDAFTFLGPVSENCSELGLDYRTLRNERGHYDYTKGKGLIFGDHFLHSTTLGEASDRTVLLSFTFGTDRMENWPKIAKTAAKQGIFHCQPDGRFAGTAAGA